MGFGVPAPWLNDVRLMPVPLGENAIFLHHARQKPLVLP